MNHLEIYYDDLTFRSLICPDFQKNKCRWQKQKYCKFAHGEHHLRCKEFITKGKCSKEHSKLKKYGGLTFETLKSLKNIDIDISQNYCGLKGIEFLMDGFQKHFSGLEEICLNISKNNLDPESLGVLRDGILLYYNDLKILRLNLSGNTMKDAGIENLFDGLDGLASKKFQELSINFSQNFIKEDSLKYLSKGLISLGPHLRELSLNLSNNKINPQSLESLATESKTFLKNLESFALSINSWEIGEKNTDILIRILSQLNPNVRTLRLDIGRNKMTLLAVKKFTKSLKSFEKLHHFDLNISKNILEDEGIEALCLVMKEMKYLVTLKLNLALCDFKKKGMFALSNTLDLIGKGLVMLEANLSMNAFEVDGMEKFVNSLLRFGSKLTTLSLKFYKNFIGKEGQKMIIDCLRMVKIKRYMLNIAYNFDKKIKGPLKQKILADLLVAFDFSVFSSQEVMDEYFGDYAEASAYLEEYKVENP